MNSLLLGSTILLGGFAAAVAEPLPAFTFCLQPEKFSGSRPEVVEVLAKSGVDWLVIDFAFNGNSGSLWTKEEIERMRAGRSGRNVIAYLSIGQAGTFRSYWDVAWVTPEATVSDQAPDWLLGANPQWPENYRVEYWRSAWQEIVMKQLDAILEAGFDGVWLDTVDSFEAFELDRETGQWVENRLNPETGQTYRQDMIAFIQNIAERGRKTKPEFLVIPNNATQLLSQERHRQVISGQGLEDLFTDGNQMQDREHTKRVLHDLWAARADDIPMLLVEYGEKETAKNLSIVAAKQQGISLLLTDRLLTTLGTAYLPD